MRTVEDLTVTWTFPQKGDTHEPIAAGFSKPMVSASEVGILGAHDVLALDPPLSGQQFWVSQTTVVFIPARPLSGASRIEVTVEAGLRDVDGGATTAEATHWSVIPTEPTVVDQRWLDSADGFGDGSEHEPPLLLIMSRPVSLAEMRPAIRVSAVVVRANPDVGDLVVSPAIEAHEASALSLGTPTPVPVVLMRPRGQTCLSAIGLDDPRRCVLVVPRRGWPPGARITVERPDDGWTLVSPGGPFVVTDGTCQFGQCTSSMDRFLRFSQPLAADAAKHVHLQPSPKSASITVEGESLRIRGIFSAKRTEVLFDPGFEDLSGDALTHPRRVWLDSAPDKPDWSVEGGPLIVDRRGSTTLVGDLSHASAPSLRMATISLAEVPSWWAALTTYGGGTTGEHTSLGRSVVAVSAGAPENANEWGIPLGRATGGGPGLVVFEAKDRGGSILGRGLVQLTTLGLTSVVHPNRSLFWVTDLASAAAVPRARVQVLDASGHRIFSGVTDAEGLLPGPGSRALLRKAIPRAARDDEDFDPNSMALFVSAAKGRDATLTPLPMPYIDDVDEQQPRLTGVIWADAPLYAAGDTVHVKGYTWMYGAEGLELANAVEDIDLSLERTGAPPITTKASLSALGGFDAEFELPDADLHLEPGERVLGRSWVTATLDGFDGQLWTHVETAAFRRPTLEVSVAPGASDLIRGQVRTIRVSAHELAGRGSTHHAVTGGEIRVRGVATSYRPPGVPADVTFDRPYGPTWDLPGDWAPLHVGDDGTADYVFAAPVGHFPTREVRVNANLRGIDQQEAWGSASMRVHPGLFYLGVRLVPSEAPRQVGQRLEAEVYAFAPDGGTVESAPENLVISLGKLTDDGQRRLRYATCRGVHGDGPLVARCSTLVVSEGTWLAWASANDALGNTLSGSQQVWIGERPPSSWRSGEVSDVPALTRNRETYALGESASIGLEGGLGLARGLLVVEGWSLTLTAQLELTDRVKPLLELPINTSRIPGVWVHMMALAPRPSFKLDPLGYDVSRPKAVPLSTEVTTDLSAQWLGVTLSATPTVVEPGGQLRVDVRVSDTQGAGEVAEVTLWAVDEAILALRQYKVPDLLSQLQESGQGTQTEILDSRKYLAERLGFSEPGSGSVGLAGHVNQVPRVVTGRPMVSGGLPRSDFRATAFFLPDLQTDAQGRATAHVEMPDSLTRYRIFATAAATGPRWGTSETTVQVSRSLAGRLALPRFASVGDRFSVAAVVTNRAQRSRHVEASLTVAGLEMTTPTGVSLTLGPMETGEAHFVVSASRRGTAKLTLNLKAADGATDSVRDDLEIIEPTVSHTEARTGEVDGNAAFSLAIPPAALRDRGGLEISVSGSALDGLQDAMESLVSYPYGCAEQTTSRLLPLLALRRLGADIGGLNQERIDRLTAAGWRRLSTMADAEGLSYWPGGTPDPWVSAYVALALSDDAQSAHPSAPSAVIDSVHRGLTQALEMLRRPETADVIALALYAAAESGDPTPVATLRAAVRARDTLSVASRFFVLRAVHLATQRAPGQWGGLRDVLLAEAWRTIAVSDDRAFVTEQTPRGTTRWSAFESSARSHAIALAVLEVVDPANPKLAPLARGLMALRRAGSWRNTQENAWALRALVSFHEAHRGTGAASVEVKVHNKPLLTHTFKTGSIASETRRLTMASLAGFDDSVDVQIEGSGARTHYRVALTTYSLVAEAPTQTGGFKLRRQLETRDGELRGADAESVQLEAGATVTVHLTVETSTPRQFVAIDDGLPAGLEPIDARDRNGPGGAQASGPYDHVELHDDRVIFFVDALPAGRHSFVYAARATTPGTFRYPPVRATEMYRPESNAHTRSGSLVVTRVRRINAGSRQ